MTFQLPIVKKTSTLSNETIHITFECAMHLHGHRNKVVLLMKLLYLRILTMSLNSTNTLVGQLMTFETNISRVGLVTTTLAMKT
jgi:hypothetical protein